MNEEIGDAAAAAAAATSQRLFTLQIVNSYGSTEVERLVDDGKPFTFDGEYISRHFRCFRLFVLACMFTVCVFLYVYFLHPHL